MAENGKDASPYHQRGTETVRETAKWVAVALASIGAAIIAGVQLSDLRNVAPFDLSAELRLGLAVAGIAVGLFGVGAAIYAIAAVLTPLHLTLDRLKTMPEYANERSFFAANPEFLRSYGQDVAALKTQYDSLYQTYATARAADSQASTTATQAALTRAATQLKGANDTVIEVLRVASYEHIRRLFLSRLPAVFFFAAVAALGGIVFAWATGESKSSAFATSVGDRATLELTPAAAQKVQMDLGISCDTKSLDTVVLAETASSLEVVVLPTGSCALMRVAVPAGAGKLRGVQAIDRKSAN